MNIAIITAGGIGARMGNKTPKQFIKINKKPIIVYTLERFENNDNIDKIILVCLKKWQKKLEKFTIDYNITKVCSIIEGGETNFESIKKGVMEAHSKFKDDDIVIMHDGIRPNVSGEVIDDSLRVCKEFGNSTSVIQCVEVMMLTEDKICSTSHVHRDKLMRAQTPQAFHIGELIELYKEADKKGITNSTSLCSLFVELGRKVYLSKGSEANIKLTVPVDIEILKTLLKNERRVNNARKNEK